MPVYISRFDKDWLFYSQHRAGQTLHFGNGFSGQLLFNANYTRDVKGEYSANTFEVGPGIRVHAPWMPPAMYRFRRYPAWVLHHGFTQAELQRCAGEHLVRGDQNDAKMKMRCSLAALLAVPACAPTSVHF